MVKQNFEIKVRNGKLKISNKILNKIESYREIFKKNKKGSESIVIGTLVDEKVICIPVKREFDVERMLATYQKADDAILLNKSNDIYYADMTQCGLFVYNDEMYFKSKCGFGYTAFNVKTGEKLKDNLPEDTDINNIKITILE